MCSLKKKIHGSNLFLVTLFNSFFENSHGGSGMTPAGSTASSEYHSRRYAYRGRAQPATQSRLVFGISDGSTVIARFEPISTREKGFSLPAGEPRDRRRAEVCKTQEEGIVALLCGPLRRSGNSNMNVSYQAFGTEVANA